MTALQSELDALDHSLDAHGVLNTGVMVGPDELAYRREVEGQSSPVMCGECGYGLAPADEQCPKCGSGSREEATAFVRRDLSNLLAQHKDDTKIVPRTPRDVALAAGKPSSREYMRAYQKAKYAENKRNQAIEAKAMAKKAAKAMKIQTPIKAAVATGAPRWSVTFRRAYMTAWNRNQRAIVKAAREQKTKRTPP